MTPTIAADASSAATICFDMRSLPATLATRTNSNAAAPRRAETRIAPACSSGAAVADTNAHTMIAASGSVIGVRQVKAAGSRTHSIAPIAIAIAIVNSTVVSVKPKIEPGMASSNGAATATINRLVPITHERARARVSDTRGMDVTAASAMKGVRIARELQFRGPLFPGTFSAFATGLGRKLAVRNSVAKLLFPNVKLLSRFVRDGVPARIVLKGTADAAGKAVTLVITVAAARTLVADAFGVMALAMATGWLLGVATDAGLSMHLAREAARGSADRRFLVEVLRLRAGLAYVAATLIVFLTPAIVPPHWKMQFALVVFAQLTAAIVDTIAHYFRGVQRSEIESVIHASHRLATLALGLVVLTWWPRLDFLGAAMLLPALAAMLVSIALAWRLSRSAISNQQPAISASSFVRDILPLGAAIFISALYFRIDLYFLERWHGLEAVGGYNAVFRLVEAMRLLPAAVMAVTFPLLVQSTDTRLVQRLGGALAGAGFAMAPLGVIASTLIVTTIYGAPFAYAAPAFAMLSLSLPLFFLNYALTHQVIGWDGQRAYLLIATLALAANIVANIALVPAHGMIGAAIATLLTEVAVTAGCVTSLNLRAEPSHRTTGRNLRVEQS